MNHDPWLESWLPLIRQHATAVPVLEIGCGPGADTEALVAAGFEVVAFDLSASEIEAARARVPAATLLVRDVREPFPAEVQGTGVVIASLSLHYFPWRETVALFERVRHTLAKGGLLVCRLNSTEDVHYGAVGHPAIEPNFFLVDGQPKRFFDRAALDELLASGWHVVSLQHRVTGKYGQPKALWELVCTKCIA